MLYICVVLQHIATDRFYIKNRKREEKETRLNFSLHLSYSLTRIRFVMEGRIGQCFSTYMCVLELNVKLNEEFPAFAFVSRVQQCA